VTAPPQLARLLYAVCIDRDLSAVRPLLDYWQERQPENHRLFRLAIRRYLRRRQAARRPCPIPDLVSLLSERLLLPPEGGGSS
jgi:hypothetical protein